MDGPPNGRAVGERLFEWLQHTGQTTVDLTEQEGMSRSTVSSLLNARTEHPHLNTVRRLARHFGVTVEGFLAGPEAESPKAEKSDKWDATFKYWINVRSHAREDIEREIAAFESDKSRAHLDAIAALLQDVYDGVTLLWIAWGEKQAVDTWKEVGAADSFYRDLIDKVRGAHLVVLPEGPQNQRPGKVGELAMA